MDIYCDCEEGEFAWEPDSVCGWDEEDNADCNMDVYPVPPTSSAVHFSFDKVSVILPPASGCNISEQIWKGSLLCAARMAALRTAIAETDAPDSPLKPMFLDKDVLEIGCGRALVGLLAAQSGARSVTLTDCDDRALEPLQQATAGNPMIRVRHFLWQEDQREEEQEAERTRNIFRVQEPLRHWRDAYRREDLYAELNAEEAFDLVVASDCLYFTCQEAPLVSVLRRRVRRPHGVGIIVVQTRGNNGFHGVRFMKALEESGFDVHVSVGPWEWDGLMKRHVHSVPGQEGLTLSKTDHEVGEPMYMTVRWRCQGGQLTHH